MKIVQKLKIGHRSDGGREEAIDLVHGEVDVDELRDGRHEREVLGKEVAREAP